MTLFRRRWPRPKDKRLDVCDAGGSGRTILLSCRAAPSRTLPTPCLSYVLGRSPSGDVRSNAALSPTNTTRERSSRRFIHFPQLAAAVAVLSDPPCTDTLQRHTSLPARHWCCCLRTACLPAPALPAYYLDRFTFLCFALARGDLRKALPYNDLVGSHNSRLRHSDATFMAFR